MIFEKFAISPTINFKKAEKLNCLNVIKVQLKVVFVNRVERALIFIDKFDLSIPEPNVIPKSSK